MAATVFTFESLLQSLFARSSPILQHCQSSVPVRRYNLLRTSCRSYGKQDGFDWAVSVILRFWYRPPPPQSVWEGPLEALVTPDDRNCHHHGSIHRPNGWNVAFGIVSSNAADLHSHFPNQYSVVDPQTDYSRIYLEYSRACTISLPLELHTQLQSFELSGLRSRISRTVEHSHALDLPRSRFHLPVVAWNALVILDNNQTNPVAVNGWHLQ